jgi:hypothetical protein
MNLEVKVIQTDNDSTFTSGDFNDFLVSDPSNLITSKYCPPYHPEYNGKAEAQWKRSGTLAKKGLQQLANSMPDCDKPISKFQVDAYLWAAHTTNRWNISAPDGPERWYPSPTEQLFGQPTDDSHLIPFGVPCSVHKFVTDKEQILPGKLGYTLGYSERRPDGCIKVYFDDTDRVVNTIDWTISRSAVSITTGIDSDLGDPTSEGLDDYRGDDPISVDDDVDIACAIINKDNPLAKSRKQVLKGKPCPSVKWLNALPQNLRLVTGSSLPSCKSDYMRDRCVKASGMTIAQCRSMIFKDAKGVPTCYGGQHLMYDLNRSYMDFEATTDHHDPVFGEPEIREISITSDSPLKAANAVHQVGKDISVQDLHHESQTWLNQLEIQGRAENKSVEERIGSVNNWDRYHEFDEKTARFLHMQADMNPLGDASKHVLEIEWENGDTQHYAFVVDRFPHGLDPAAMKRASQEHDRASQEPLPLEVLFTDEYGTTSEKQTSAKVYTAARYNVTPVNIPPPKSFREVLRHPERELYLRSVAKEYNGLDTRNLYKLVPLPTGEKAIPVTLVNKMKRDASGNPTRAKSRICIRGDLMEAGKHFGATYSPTSQMETVRAQICDACMNDKVCVTYDLVQAFTFGKMEKEVYLKQFPGRRKKYDEVTGEELVLQLMFQLYGSPEAPAQFHRTLHQAYMDFDYQGMKWKRCHSDPCLYSLKCSKDQSLLLSSIFVDDSCNTFKLNSQAEQVYKAFIAFLQDRFELQDDGMGELDSFLGMNITWSPDRSAVRIDQPGAIKELLTTSGLIDSHPRYTPFPPNKEVMLTDCPSDGPEGDAERNAMAKLPYRRRIGQLLWICRVSRPDICHAVSRLASVAHNPGKKHWDMTTYLIQYVGTTSNLGIVYLKNGTERPYGMVDACFGPDYGFCGDNFRSNEGEVHKWGNGPISWCAPKQKLLATSSTVAEYFGLSSAVRTAIHLSQLYSDIGCPLTEPYLIYEDNQAAIKMSQNTANSKRTKFLGIRQHYIREQVNLGNVDLAYCHTSEMTADAMTKSLARPTFELLRNRMGVSSYLSENISEMPLSMSSSGMAH